MKKFIVYGIATASWKVGEFEAESKEEAIELAENSGHAQTPSVCHQCARKIEIGDVNEYQAEEI